MVNIMKQYILNIFTVAFIFLVIGCTKNDDSEDEKPNNLQGIINGLNDGGVYSEIVSDKGGTISVTFTTNTDWILETYSNIEYTPKIGGKGENRVTITIPQNMDVYYDKRYDFTLYSKNDRVYIASFTIKQNKAPLLELPNTIEFEQSATSKVVDVTANGLYSVEIPEKDTSWLSYSIDETKRLNLRTTQNPSVESRTTVVILTLGSLRKEITITQKGGVIFETSMADQENGNTIGADLSRYYIPPTGGGYLLYVSSNAKFEWTQSEQKDGLKVEEISTNDFAATYSITAEKLGENEGTKKILLKFQFENDEEQEVSIYQETWDLSIKVYKGESLTAKINAVADKVEQGYKITDVYINSGNIDDSRLRCPSLKSLTIENVTEIPRQFCQGCDELESVTVRNVDIIPERFCGGCQKLRSLTLSNVQKIGARAFLGTDLSYISIPSTVTYIADRAFQTGHHWYVVTCYSPTPPTLGTHVFYDGIGGGELRVPMGSKPKYVASSKWNNQFGDIVEF